MGCGVGAAGAGGSPANLKLPDDVEAKWKEKGGGKPEGDPWKDFLATLSPEVQKEIQDMLTQGKDPV